MRIEIIEFQYLTTDQLDLALATATIHEPKVLMVLEVTPLTADQLGLLLVVQLKEELTDNHQLNQVAGQHVLQIVGVIQEAPTLHQQVSQVVDLQELKHQLQVIRHRVQRRVVDHQGLLQVHQVVAVHHLGDHHVN